MTWAILYQCRPIKGLPEVVFVGTYYHKALELLHQKYPQLKSGNYYGNDDTDHGGSGAGYEWYFKQEGYEDQKELFKKSGLRSVFCLVDILLSDALVIWADESEQELAFTNGRPWLKKI